MNNTSTFGTMLRAARIDAGKTLRETGKAVGWSVSFIHDTEHSRRAPPGDLTRIATLATFLGADPRPLKVQACRERGSVPLPPGATDERIATVLRWLEDGE